MILFHRQVGIARSQMRAGHATQDPGLVLGKARRGCRKEDGKGARPPGARMSSWVKAAPRASSCPCSSWSETSIWTSSAGCPERLATSPRHHMLSEGVR